MRDQIYYVLPVAHILSELRNILTNFPRNNLLTGPTTHYLKH